MGDRRGHPERAEELTLETTIDAPASLDPAEFDDAQHRVSEAAHRAAFDLMVAAFRGLVRRGAEWLDEEEPGWAKAINVERLDMLSGCYCVGGQLFGNYEALSQIRLPHPPAEYGFELPPGDLARDLRAWALLTDLWRQEIEARKEAQ